MIYIKNIDKVRTECNRVIGLKKLYFSNLLIPSPIKIISPKAFIEYKRLGGKFSGKFVDELYRVFGQIRDKNPTRGVYVGRAFYVPGMEHPPGPRSSSVEDPEVALNEMKKLFEFAIKNKFDKEGSEIGSIMYPYISPKIPFGGGSITPAQRDKNLAIVETIYGVDEGIQSFSHDTYMVDVKKGKILEKKIEIKSECLQVGSQHEHVVKKVPKNLQNLPVYTDKTIVEITKDFKKFTDRYGLHRFEFAGQPEGVYFREGVKFTPVETVVKDVKVTGKVLRIKSSKDVGKVNKEIEIVYLDPEIIQKRNMDLLVAFACGVKERKIVLYPGNASTAHAATILREKGHVMVFVGADGFKTGNVVKVDLENGELKAERVK